jgi:hypothetical protein
MAKNIESWLVEEVDSATGRKIFSQTYSSSEEAFEAYESLTKMKPDSTNLVSVTKTSKRLLIE